MAELTKLKTSPIDDKYWLVEEDYYYQCSLGTIVVPKGFKTDYASIPRLFRNIINSYGKHGRAAVVHDWLYSKECYINCTRKQADVIFLEIMEECNVDKLKRQLMYRMVRLFGSNHFRKGF